MTVTRLVEPIRITRPFEEADWEALLAVGDRVEETCRPRTCA